MITPQQAYEKRYAAIDNGQHTWEAAPDHVKDLWLAAWTIAWVQAEAAERESCDKLCDEIAIDMWNLYKGRPPYKGDEEGRASDFTQGRSAGADDCAEAIRKRSNT